jgi:hypothetical protein
MPVDRIAREIGQDAANWKNVSARGPFSDQNPSKMMINKRMAELGIDPNNISGSIRDRAATASTVLPHLDETAQLRQQCVEFMEGLVIQVVQRLAGKRRVETGAHGLPAV